MTLAIILSGVAVLISGATFILVMVLLGRSDFQYCSQEDLAKVEARLRKNQSDLWDYVEAVDDQSGGRGHQVLGVWVPGDKTSA